MNNKIIVIDFGSMHSPRILGFLEDYSDLEVETINWKDFDNFNNFYNLLGIILSGSPAHLYEPGAPQISSKILNMKVPILGICYGMQMIAKLIGGEVVKMDNKESGDYKVRIVEKSDLFEGLPDLINTAMRHSDQVVNIPGNYKITAYSDNCIAAMEFVNANDSIYIYCLQFHPELKLKGSGLIIMKNFLKICRKVSLPIKNNNICSII